MSVFRRNSRYLKWYQLSLKHVLVGTYIIMLCLCLAIACSERVALFENSLSKPNASKSFDFERVMFEFEQATIDLDLESDVVIGDKYLRNNSQ